MTAFFSVNQKYVRVAVAAVLAIFMAGLLLQNAAPALGAEPVAFNGDITIRGDHYGVINGDQIYSNYYDNSGYPIYNFLCAYDMGEGAQISLAGDWGGCQNTYDDFWVQDLVGVGSQLYILADDLTAEEDTGPGYHLFAWNGGNYWDDPILFTLSSPAKLYEADGTIFADTGSLLRRYNTSGGLLAAVSYSGDILSITAAGNTFWLNTTAGVQEYVSGVFTRTLAPYTDGGNVWYANSVVLGDQIWISATDSSSASQIGATRLYGLDLATGAVEYQIDDFGRDASNNEWDYIGRLTTAGVYVYGFGEDFIVAVDSTTGLVKSTLANTLDTIGTDLTHFSSASGRLMAYPVYENDNHNTHPGAAYYSIAQFGSARFDAEGFIVNEETLFNGEAFQGMGATIDTWAWDFGDDTTASGEDVSHTYTEAGTYHVKLTVEMTDGSRVFAEQDLDVAPTLPDTYEPLPPLPPLPAMPDANFNVEPIAGEAPLTAFFYSDTSAGGAPESWLWDFGDGTTSTLENPSHTYADPGTYTVSLTVANAAGSDTETKTDVVHAQRLPVAAFSATPLSGVEPLLVTFTNTSTDALTYAWDFGDSTTSTASTPTHTYAAGTYTVTLTATNNDGTDAEVKTNYITVEANTPMPGFTGRAIMNNGFDSAANAAGYPGTLTNGTMVNSAAAGVNLRSARILAITAPTTATTYNVAYRATGAGSMKACSVNLAFTTSNIQCTALPVGATLGSVQQTTMPMRSTDSWVWFETIGSVTYDDLRIVDPNAAVGTLTASAVTASLSYAQASTGRTVWPFKSGALTITSTFSAAPSNTPTISINQPGVTDVTNAAMTATGNPAVWTYNYNISTQTGTSGSSTFTDGVVRVTVNALDSNSVAINPATNNYFTDDTLVPVTPALSALAANSNNPSPTLTASSANGTEFVTSYYVGGSTLLGTRCCINGSPTLAAGPLADGTYSFTAKNTDIAGNVGTTSAARTTTIDTVAPVAPSLPDLTNDSGVPNDNITNELPMIFEGTAPPFTTVQMYFGTGNWLGTTTSDSNGDWLVSVNSAWSGSFFNAATVDAAGNISRSGYMSVTFYNAPPAVDEPVLAPSSDSGLQGDRLTNDTTPTITVSENGIGDGIALYLNGALIASAPDSPTDNSSTLTTTLGPLADGSYTVEARTVDFVNNIGSSPITLVIDTSTPGGEAGAPVLDPASDSAPTGDSLTNDNTPTLSGTAPPDALPTTLSLNKTPAVDDISGQGDSWYANGTNLSTGLPTGAAYVTDGNDATYGDLRFASTCYGALAWYVDLIAPQEVGSVRIKTALYQYRGDDSGIAYNPGVQVFVDGRASTSDPWTQIYADASIQPEGSVRTLNISSANAGPWRYVRFRIENPNNCASPYWSKAPRVYASDVISVAQNDSVGIYQGNTLLASTQPTGGVYTITMPTMADGDYNLTARLTNGAGNAGIASGALPLSIDANGPVSSASQIAAQSSLSFGLPYSASDAHTVSGVQLFYSSDPQAALGDFTQFGSSFTSSPIAFTAPAAGTYRFYTIGTDGLGNIESLPASADAEIDVTAGSGPPPPPDNGDMSSDSDGDTVWTTSTTVYSDPTAPSGDGEIVRLAAPDGEIANGFSESLYVEPGQTVTVTGSWRLSGHGSILMMCFDNGECPASESLGDISGSSIYDIGWTPFTLEAVVPADSYWVYLDWSVGSDSDIDNLSWNLDATDSSITRVDVTSTISVEAPALIDMGAGIPGDELTANANVVVTTNNVSGYDLDVAVTDMSAGGSDTIAASALSRRNTAGGSFDSFTAANAALSLSASADRTDAAGDTVNMDLRVLLPFVDTGVYEGTATFTATTH